MTTNHSPLFEGNSSDRPSILTISFASDPTASLGVQLASHDNGLTNEMFSPGYSSVGGVPDDSESSPTLAKKFGVKVGDYLVAVNGEGYRRFPPDFPEEELEELTKIDTDLINLSSVEEEGKQQQEQDTAENDDDNDQVVEKEEPDDFSYKPPSAEEQKRQLKGRVIHANTSNPGEVYDKLLTKIRQIKAQRDPSNPLVLSLERYMWDSRVHSWSRFLSARRGNVPEAMTMIQAHERWRNDFFPIDLTNPSLQQVMKAHAVSEVDIGEGGHAAVVYIDFAKLQMMATGQDLSMDVVQAFVVYTEALLSRSPDPRRPKTSQMVDLTGVNLKQGFKVNMLKKMYRTFEPNYPETLEKMVMYPVPKALVSVVNAMLSFVNEHTRKKFVITDDLFVVCKELGWNLKEIESCGGVRSYMKKHLKHGLSFVFDD
eukprot:CAMPEP_0201714288 /NCGR_PEP_ID=MMETSP0593-20130828/838_1 /ASSEMBLY_ACC=CAM_ASM_000672 /TAXON_ID=267983 /ORGANISM="Skeletonema japonicum, Strain CCMP2506" /LENGTH=427 /DNA_ID=CAMNT_0048203555 /DNA_START=23 /DNA_END=1306 /DNA_ORIENTATION=+